MIFSLHQVLQCPTDRLLTVGCSQALLASSHLYHEVKKNAESHGVMVDGVRMDLGKMMAQKDTAVSGLTKGIEGLFKKYKACFFLHSAAPCVQQTLCTSQLQNHVMLAAACHETVLRMLAFCSLAGLFEPRMCTVGLSALCCTCYLAHTRSQIHHVSQQINEVALSMHRWST